MPIPIPPQYAAKIEVISNLHSHYTDQSAQFMLKLLDILIAETREENDYIEPATLSANQAKIAICKQLKQYILQGEELPTA
jgi:hypothetical protein